MDPRPSTVPRADRLLQAGVLSSGARHALVAAALCAALVAAGAYAGWRERQRQDSHAVVLATNLSRLLEAKLADSFDQVDLSLQVVASHHADQKARGGVEPARLAALLAKIQAAQPELKDLRVLDTQGAIKYGRTARRDDPASLEDRENFQRLRDFPAAGLVISSPQPGSPSGPWGVALSRRLEDPDGSFAGVVSAIWTSDSLHQALASADLGPHGMVAVHARDLSVIYRFPPGPRDDELTSSVPVPDDLRRALEARPAGGNAILVGADDGQRRTVSWRQLARHPYFVMVGIAEEDYLGDWRRSMVLLAGFVALAVLSIGVSALWLWRSSQRLRDAGALWKFALEGSEQGVWDYHLPERRIETTPRYARIIGHEPEDLVEDAEWHVGQVHEDDIAGLRAAIERHLRGETPRLRTEFRMRHKDGDFVWIESCGSVVEWTADGKPKRMIGTHADVSARKDFERQVVLLNEQLEKRAVDAETSTRAKDAFLRNISHEFRTPLNQVMGGIDLLLADAADPARKERLLRIQTPARELLRLIEDTLDVARLEAGDLALETVPFSPVAVMDGVRLLLSHRARAKGLSLELAACDGLPDPVQGDPARVSQALLNYVDNAIKFTERGAVTIGAREISRKAGHVVLRFEVRDTGIGIAPQAHASIFKAFSQVDATVARRYGGAGIGLAATCGLARLMEGDVGVESAPGEGSLFWFTARFAVPEGRAEEAKTHDRASVLADLALLEELLAQDDVRSGHVFHGSAARLRVAFPDEFELLRHLVDGFDYEKALAVVRRMRGRQGDEPEEG